MAKNFFAENRRNMQRYVRDIGFIKPITNSLFKIGESKNKKGSGKLSEVQVANIPFDDMLERTWEVDFDIEEEAGGKHIINTPQGKKKCEKALIILINRRLHIFMFEMKSEITNDTNKDNSLSAIKDKWIDTMERISFLLNIYCPEHWYEEGMENGEQVYFRPFDNVKIEYTGVLIYNSDSIPTIQKEEEKTDIYKVFKGEQKRLNLENQLLGKIPMETIFFKNTKSDKEFFKLDFKDIFTKEIKDISLFCP
jgi:hypothetical protein